jgi:hypothetical protein
MAIPEDKARLIITLPDRLKSNLEFLCDMDKRTSSKELEFILEYYIDSIEKRFSQEDYDKYYEEEYLPKQLADRIIAFITTKSSKFNGELATPRYFNELFKYETITDKVYQLVMNSSKMTMEHMRNFNELMNSLRIRNQEKD